ncbi:MAG TPA: DNA polymerase I [Planctomycetota bacterium]|nr:DNA polymerase I [Planctomycetota bacterium]HRU51862.1 DNA polymerase I [Planctomycetota bacterium]
MSQTLYILDGHAYTYQAFYAIKELYAPDGTPSNAIYGFLRMLDKLIREKEPTSVAVCFDCHAPVFRNELYKEYKSTRKPMPEEMRGQIPMLQEILQNYGIPIFLKEGYEADDVIATLAYEVSQWENWHVYICTPDKDAVQILTQHISQYDPKKDEVFTYDQVYEKYGIPIENFIEYFALLGDTSDNIPGVRGIGPKNAAKLINQFQTLENLYEKINQVKPQKIKNALQSQKEQAFLSRTLFTIDQQVPIEINKNEIIQQKLNQDALEKWYIRLGFLKSLSNLDISSSKASSDIPVHCISTKDELKKIVSIIPSKEPLYVDWKESGDTCIWDAELQGIFCSWNFASFYVQANDSLKIQDILNILQPLLSKNNAKRGFDCKNLYILLLIQGLHLQPIDFDISLAVYLCNLYNKEISFQELCLQYCQCNPPALPTTEDIKSWCSYFAQRNYLLRNMEKQVQKQLEKHDLVYILQEELSLIPILAEMEVTGILVDPVALHTMCKEVREYLLELKSKIYHISGKVFNISSPKQLGNILFDKMKFPVIKKTKTGDYSTNKEILETLLDQVQDKDREFLSYIIEYRDKEKLLNTYLEPLPTAIHPTTKRIHSHFIQTGAATGRITSKQPNLQAIPIRSEFSRSIRKSFIAPIGSEIIQADYSQIELRILAHFSQEPALIHAFQNNQDIHSTVASQIFQTPLNSVTHEQRQRAKTVQYGILYGQTQYGLSKQLKISFKEAHKIINSYFQEYPKVQEFRENMLEQIREQKYAKTLQGRKRFFPDISSTNRNVRERVEREAFNSIMQGTAADILKIALKNIYQKRNQKMLPFKILLQIHDEIILESLQESIEETIQLLRQEMENAVSLQVPLKVEISHGKNWLSE